MTTIQTVSLGTDLRVEDLQRRVWRELHRMAMETMEGMHGDLFTDAVFLIREMRDLPIVDRPFTFVWGVRSMGTDITRLPENDWFQVSRQYQDHIYRMSVHQDYRGAYYLQFAEEAAF